MNPEPLNGKPPYGWINKHGENITAWNTRDVRSAIEWLLSKRLGDKLKAFDFEGKEMLVFYKEDFDRAFANILEVGR